MLPVNEAMVGVQCNMQCCVWPVDGSNPFKLLGWDMWSAVLNERTDVTVCLWKATFDLIVRSERLAAAAAIFRMSGLLFDFIISKIGEKRKRMINH